MITLTWSAPAAPNPDCRYDHSIAVTPFGRFLLTWKSWKGTEAEYGFDETPWGVVEYHGWRTLQEAQDWAAQEMARRIKTCSPTDDIVRE